MEAKKPWESLSFAERERRMAEEDAYNLPEIPEAMKPWVAKMNARLDAARAAKAQGQKPKA